MGYSLARQPRISGWQMSVLVFFAGSHINIVFTSRYLAASAGPDSWLSLLLGYAVAAGLIVLAGNLSSRFPEKTFVEYSNTLAGSLVGRFISLSIALIFLGITAMQVRHVGHFIKSTLLISTPMEVVIVASLVAVAYVLRHGLTTVTRLGELIFPIFIVSALFMIIISIPSLQFGRFTPFLSKGFLPVLKGGLVISTATLGYALPLFFAAFMLRPEDAMSKGVLGIVLTTTLTGSLLLFPIAVFGVAEASYGVYPFTGAGRFIELPGGVLERVDVLLAFLVIMALFVGLTIYFTLTVMILARILGLREPGLLALILLPVVYFLSFRPGNFLVVEDWYKKLSVAGFAWLSVSIAFFLLLALIRKRV